MFAYIYIQRQRMGGCVRARADCRVWVLNFQSCDDNRTVAHPSQSPPEKKKKEKDKQVFGNKCFVAVMSYLLLLSTSISQLRKCQCLCDWTVVSAIAAEKIGHTCTEANSDTDCGDSSNTPQLSCPTGATTCTCDAGYTGVAGGDCG